MRLILPAALLLGLGSAALSAAWAQNINPNEPVIVTAPRLVEALDTVTHDFVQSYSAPARASGKLSRWRTPICPRVDGLSQASYSAFVSQRIRAVAAMAGVPLAPTPCKPNIQVMFTDNPQTFLNTARTRDSTLLGYQGAATADHAIQAWYATGTADLDGMVQTDAEVSSGVALRAGGMGDRSGLNSMGPTSRVTGTRMSSGLSSELINVLIIADRTRTGNYQLGPIADAIAMMALGQTESFDACGPMPSITNLMAASCDAGRKTEGLTDGDLAYLKGLYRMNAERPLRIQQADIVAEMKKELTH